NIAIRTTRYTNIDTTTPTTKVYGLEYLLKRFEPNSKILLVDDVFDSGLSIKAVIDKLHKKLEERTPIDIRVATIITNQREIKQKEYQIIMSQKQINGLYFHMKYLI